MSRCEHCGAPLERDFVSRATCKFCGYVNSPLQREVEVAVPVQVVHQVVQVSGGTAPEAVELRCPYCRQRLVTIVAKGVELAGCGGCGGIWVDNASSRQVLAQPEAVFVDLARRAGDNARHREPRSGTPSCPTCSSALDRVVTRELELDVCADHGTWFDPFELGELVESLAGRTPHRAPSTDRRRIRCASCATDIGIERANITPSGLRCDPCWRAEQAAAIVVADREAQTSAVVAVGGALLGVAAVMLGASRSA